MGTQQQTSYKILLIGEHCDDVYHYGLCDRLSPEAPVPVFVQHEKEVKAGMASNVKLNLQALGSKVTHYKNSEIIEKHRLYDTKFNHHIIRFDIGETNDIDGLPIQDLPNEEFDAIVISDYNKGFITHDIAKHICTKYKGKRIFVDTKKTDLSCYENCIIKVNELEYEAITKKPKSSRFIITLGSRGAKYNRKIFPTTQEIEVYDVCGAGDVFLATLVVKYLDTKNIQSSICAANKAAAISVTKTGAYVLQREDIEVL
jgi:bifunctional ADP-heptose synthase (sugar kinase/adenylyltransferase)